MAHPILAVLILAAAHATPSPAPTPKPAASATPAATATPAPLPTATPAAARSRLVYEASAIDFARVQAVRYNLVAPGVRFVALEPIGPVFAGASIGWRHLSGGRSLADYRGRVLDPYVVDVDVVPIEAFVRAPVSGDVSAIGSAGLEWARSSFDDRANIPEHIVEMNTVPTIMAGAQWEHQAGRHRILVTAGMRFARHSFYAHDFELLHGVELGAGYRF